MRITVLQPAADRLVREDDFEIIRADEPKSGARPTTPRA
jgi:hypothetical protein